MDSIVEVHEGNEALAAAGQSLAPLSAVPVAIQVRLGSTCLPLGELMRLRPGQVVTLERDMNTPAEIMVGDKVIALGQIVLVGTELGVRVLSMCDGVQ